MIDTPVKPVPKRWFSDGATMAYPARSRAVFWLAYLLLFVLLNMFDLRLRTGLWFQLRGPYETSYLINELLSPVNIFNYPTEILVRAMLMAMLCTVPILIALLYNFLFSIPFLAAVLFLGHNPILCLCLFVSCAAVGFDPLRFKSKFVAAVMAVFPEILYWWFFSGENPETDRLRWAVLYSPWVLAFLGCLVIIGLTIVIGHFFHYQPGILLPVFGVFLAGDIILFNSTIGMNERDYQAQVVRFSPQKNPELQSLTIVPLLEKELAERKKIAPYLTDELIMNQLQLDWRWAFIGGPSLSPDQYARDALGGSPSQARLKSNQVYTAKSTALEHMDAFIRTHPRDRRISDALYFKATLFDMRTDQRSLRDDKYLRFYYNIPSRDSMPFWEEILNRFPESPASIEARWRLAFAKARLKPQSTTDSFQFDQAMALLDDARTRCDALFEKRHHAEKPGLFHISRLGSVFPPRESTLTDEDLPSLQWRINRLYTLISKENRTGHLRHEERLAEFVGLDTQQLDYDTELKNLLLDSPQPDPLIDNIELAEAMLIKNTDEKIVRLTDLIRQYNNTDGAIEARWQLAQILLDQRQQSKHEPDRRQLLTSAWEQLRAIISLKPKSFWARQAEILLKNNPIE